MKISRNKNIALMYLEGKTTADIAPKFGISIQRIRQILKKQRVKMRKPKKRFCVDCSIQVTSKNAHSSGDVCFVCIKIRKETRSTFWAPMRKLYACTECQTDDIEHQGGGLCRNCYSRNRWKTEPEYRKNHYQMMKNWKKRNREEHIANSRACSNRYYRKHRKEFLMYYVLIKLVNESV